MEGRKLITGGIILADVGEDSNILVGGASFLGPAPKANSVNMATVDPELRALMIFLVNVLKSHLPKLHVVNQRSLRTLLKYHTKDLLTAVQSLLLISDLRTLQNTSSGSSEVLYPGDGGKEREVLVDQMHLLKMPMYIVVDGCATVWRQKVVGGQDSSSDEERPK